MRTPRLHDALLATALSAGACDKPVDTAPKAETVEIGALNRAELDYRQYVRLNRRADFTGQSVDIPEGLEEKQAAYLAALEKQGKQPPRLKLADPVYDEAIQEAAGSEYAWATDYITAIGLTEAYWGGNNWVDHATSPAGARGLFQIMPDTAKHLGVNPDDPADNARGGARYFAELYARYKDPYIVDMAYNCGPGAMDNHLYRMREDEGITHPNGLDVVRYLIKVDFDHQTPLHGLKYALILDAVDIPTAKATIPEGYTLFDRPVDPNQFIRSAYILAPSKFTK